MEASLLEIRTEMCISLMKTRGYKNTATGSNGETLFFLKKIDDVITVHATVRVERLTVELDIIGTLGMNIKLLTEAIIVDTNCFDKTEEELIRYGNICLNGNSIVSKRVEPVNKTGLGQTNKGTTIEKTFDQRKKEFWEKIRQVGKQKSYEKDMCIEFYEYWTQKNELGKKMRFEKETTWDLAGRLRTWLRNDKNWTKRYNNIQEAKAEKQNVELAQTGTNHVSTKDLF